MEFWLSAMPASFLHRKKRCTCCDCRLWLVAFSPNLPRQNVEHLATSQPGCGVLIQLHVLKAREREGFDESTVTGAVRGGCSGETKGPALGPLEGCWIKLGCSFVICQPQISDCPIYLQYSAL